jgi:hypothetical protein
VSKYANQSFTAHYLQKYAGIKSAVVNICVRCNYCYLGHMPGDKVRAVIIFRVISPGVNFSVAGNARVLEATSSPPRH